MDYVRKCQPRNHWPALFVHYPLVVRYSISKEFNALEFSLTDSVLIEGLEVETVVGVYDWERTIDQRLVVDLEMAWDNRIPGRSDNVADALDYAAVSKQVNVCLKQLQPQLLERGAEVLAAELQEVFGISWLRLTLRKPGAVPTAQSVGVRIERGVR